MTDQSGAMSQQQTGSQSPGAYAGTQSQGGHSISQGGSVSFSNMQIPGLTFPATTGQIQTAVRNLPEDQQQTWLTTIDRLPTEQTYNSLQELQEACTQQADNKVAA